MSEIYNLKLFRGFLIVTVKNNKKKEEKMIENPQTTFCVIGNRLENVYF